MNVFQNHYFLCLIKSHEVHRRRETVGHGKESEQSLQVMILKFNICVSLIRLYICLTKISHNCNMGRNEKASIELQAQCLEHGKRLAIQIFLLWVNHISEFIQSARGWAVVFSLDHLLEARAVSTTSSSCKSQRCYFTTIHPPISLNPLNLPIKHFFLLSGIIIFKLGLPTTVINQLVGRGHSTQIFISKLDFWLQCTSSFLRCLVQVK